MKIIQFDLEQLRKNLNGFSCYILGRSYDLEENFYYNGVGTEQDIEKAKYYLKLACEAGLPRAIKKYNEYGFGTKKM